MKRAEDNKEKKKLKNQEDFEIGLPRWLLFSSKLTAKDLRFCMVLYHHRNPHTKLCCPGLPLLCSEAHLSDRTIKKIRKKLSRLGIITYQKGTGRKHHTKYKLNWIDGSNQEIEKLKSILMDKKVGKKFHYLTSEKVSPVSSEIFSPVTSEKISPITTDQYNNKTIKQQQQDKTAAADFSFSKFLRGKTLKILKGYGLSDNTIAHLIAKAPAEDKDKYFKNWINYIETSNINRPAGFLIRMVEKGEMPSKLQGDSLVERVHRYNELTGKNVKAERSKAFEEFLLKEALDYIEERVHSSSSNESEEEQERKMRIVLPWFYIVDSSLHREFMKGVSHWDPWFPIDTAYENYLKNA